VLIVEDDEAFAAYLQETLSESAEIDVVGWGSNGLEAISLATALRPDVVTMDIHLPRLDGVEATKLILAQHPQTAIILVSGSEYQERALEGRDAGAADYLRKSQVDTHLVDAVISAVGAARGSSLTE
jgi:DNA-binding NarL/FixJ family response regulator